MRDRNSYRLGMAVVLLLVFGVSSGVAVLAGYGMLAIDTPLLATAMLVAICSLYGFYASMTGFVASNGSTERMVG